MADACVDNPADAHRHAEVVLAFAEQTGASLYQQRAEVFIKASA